MKVATFSLLTTRKLVGGGSLREAAAARGIEVEEDFAVVLAGLVGLQRHADRLALRRPVGDVEAPVVLGALDELAFDEPVGEMGVAVRADAVGGVKLALGGAVNGVGLLVVIEADDVFLLQEVAHADFDPAVHRLAFGGEDVRGGRGIGAEGRSGQLAFDVIARGLSPAAARREASSRHASKMLA